MDLDEIKNIDWSEYIEKNDGKISITSKHDDLLKIIQKICDQVTIKNTEKLQIVQNTTTDSNGLEYIIKTKNENRNLITLLYNEINDKWLFKEINSNNCSENKKNDQAEIDKFIQSTKENKNQTTDTKIDIQKTTEDSDGSDSDTDVSQIDKNDNINTGVVDSASNSDSDTGTDTDSDNDSDSETKTETDSKIDQDDIITEVGKSDNNSILLFGGVFMIFVSIFGVYYVYGKKKKERQR